MNKMARKPLSVLLTLALLLGLLPAAVTTALADGSVSYQGWDGEAFVEQSAVCTAVTSDETTWPEGWYVADGIVSVGTIRISGTVNLILCDNASLTAKGIFLPDGCTLNIYAQSEGNGELTSTGRNTGAGIGGYQDYGCGTLNIYGGVITATGDSTTPKAAAGIGGGGVGGSGGTVAIYGARSPPPARPPSRASATAAARASAAASTTVRAATEAAPAQSTAARSSPTDRARTRGYHRADPV